MLHLLLASTGDPTYPAPDSGATGILLGAAVLGLLARYIKNNRK